MSEIAERIEENIGQRQLRLKQWLKQRVWLCSECRQVMGVFSEDFQTLDVQCQRVNLTISGGDIRRVCHRCHTENTLRTRRPGEEVAEWLEAFKHQLAHP